MPDCLILNKDGSPLSVIPLSVVSWQTAIRLVTTDKVRVLENYDNWIVRSPSTSMHVPSIVITSDYIKWNRQVKYSRNNIYLRDGYACQYCGKTPPIAYLTLDHVLPKAKGGKTNWNNIVTSCQKCNSKKGDDRSIVPDKKPHKPNYYELMSMRQAYPIKIRDSKWINFLNWPSDLIHLTEHHNNA